MGQIGSYIRRKEEKSEHPEDGGGRHKVARQKANVFSSLGIHDLLGSRIPDAFLIFKTKSSEFMDEDGDVANEFYLEESLGSHRVLRRTTRNLTPQRAERYRIPRLHPDVPVVMIQVQ
ncbi:hypothetical protein PFISCL1PPCAC_15640 [Pristionchus fissidentatus]|uniref:Uncharacterized protein n=1 Tax=Pristionchus fissidentatus TaxID=1538716 RepID=A0AAV5W1I5_9BILA|nr:hypothetical protein PFISCL1PPCAC_15640 [Pristionchus fissidentatus]